MVIRETLGVSTLMVRDGDLRKGSDYVPIRTYISYEIEVMTLGDISVGNIGYKGEWNVIRR